MFQQLTRFGLSALLLAVGLTVAQAQPRTELDRLRKPVTVPQHWSAIKLEINLGKFDTAAEYLKDMLALNPTDKDLLAIEEKEGIAAFLALNDITSWSNNKAINDEAKTNVKLLISKVTAAVKALRSDPERIKKYIRNLGASPEEREYAFLELKKSGTAVMPQLIGTLVTADLTERSVILGILPKLDADTVPAIVAALDINNPTLRVEFLNVLQARPDILQLVNNPLADPRPTLWYLSAGNDLVAQKSRSFLTALTGTPALRLPAPAAELTRLADQIYQKKLIIAKEPEVQIWKYDGQQIVVARTPAVQAEEYYGLRYARWAMERDPAYELAQITFLNIAVEKALERSGLGVRLSQGSPGVYQLLATASSGVLYSMLDRALKENHFPVALGVCQVLGDRAEARGIKGSIEPLVRSLNSQDRRVALSAADALLRIPGGIAAQHSSRIIEVYRQALAGVKPASGAIYRPKAMIADPDSTRSELFGDTLRKAGYDVVFASTGRDALRRLNAAGDLDVLWVHHELPYPQLPEFLAQVRGDYRYGKLPLFVTMAEDASRSRLPEIESRIAALDRLMGIDPQGNRKLAVDLSKAPIRVTLRYDGYRVTTAEQKALQEWLGSMTKERPTVRQTVRSKQVIRVTITDKDEPGLEPRLLELANGLDQVRAVRDPITLIKLEMDGRIETPASLQTRLALLERDFGANKSKNVRINRELLTWVILTSTSGPAPAPPRAPKTLGASDLGDEDFVYTSTEDARGYERPEALRPVSRELEARLLRLTDSYQNVQVMLQPVMAEDVADAMQQMIRKAGPNATPLSEPERKDHQKRAIEALRQMAIGLIPGFDIRPASAEIIAATVSDDLAPAAIEATGRLSNKEAQQALADVVLGVARPAPIRRQAADELVRHFQRFSSNHITDAQVAGLIKLLDDEKSPEVKTGVSFALGALPSERVMKNFTTQDARDRWVKRLLNYQPAAPAAPAAPAPPAVPKDN